MYLTLMLKKENIQRIRFSDEERLGSFKKPRAFLYTFYGVFKKFFITVRLINTR